MRISEREWAAFRAAGDCAADPAGISNIDGLNRSAADDTVNRDIIDRGGGIDRSAGDIPPVADRIARPASRIVRP